MLAFLSNHFYSELRKSFLQKQNAYARDAGFKVYDISSKINVSHRHHSYKPAEQFKNVRPWVSALGASVAIADINNDGFEDIFLNDSSSENHHSLFINSKNGKFEDLTKKFKLDKLNYPHPITRALFLDCNNDNYPDLFLLSECPQLFVNHKGEYFEDYTEKSGIQKCSYASFAANVFDYDKDGNLDIIWGSYFSADIFSNAPITSGVMPENFIDSKNNASIFLMKGDGQCHFIDKSDILPKKELRGWYLSIGIQDITQSNGSDIWITSDNGIDQVLFQTSDLKTWSNEYSLIDTPSRSKNGMGVIFSDITHTNSTFAYTSNIFQKNEKVSGNLLWEFNKEGFNFKEQSNKYDLMDCGWSWGSQFVDLNMDSWDDLVVLNGFFGDSRKKSYWYSLSVLDNSNRKIMSNHNNWPDMDSFQLQGGQKDCLFINDPMEGKFHNVSNSFNFDQDKNNGRGVAYIDVNNDGHYSLVVANQDAQSFVYEIVPTLPHSWVGLSLIGKKSNTAAIGAKIYWKLSDGNSSYKELRPANGFASQSDPRFLLGFKKNLSLNGIFIVWPSGITQNLNPRELKLNSYNIIHEQSHD